MGKSKAGPSAPPSKKRKTLTRQTTLRINTPSATISKRFFNFKDKKDAASWLIIQRRNLAFMEQIDWEDFAEQGWDVPLTHELEKAGLVPIFQVTEPAFEWPTKELLSTFRYTKTTDPTDTSAIFFRLGGKPYKKSLNEFAIDLGFYTAQQL
ncbi:hypothetical protein LINPERHAP1_LOCUS4053, partial [Linum perenne]